MSVSAPRSRLQRALLVVVAVVVAVAVTSLGTGRVASAHTDFDSSEPVDGAVVDGPLDEIVVSFTNPARPAGDGFALLDPAGTIRAPADVDDTDGRSFVLTFEPPLDAGAYQLRWSVQAGDAHPIDGTIRFEVTGTSAPPATPPDSTVAPSMPASHGDNGHDMGMNTDEHAAMSGHVARSDAATLGRAGRLLSMLATVVGVGVLGALLWTVRGRRDELDAQLAWVRLAGLGVATGALIELAALAEGDPAATLGSLFSTKPGLATALKAIGGIALLVGFHPRAGRVVAPAPSLSAAAAADLATESPTRWAPRQPGGGHRWVPTRAAALGLAGSAAVLISFWFDGHTVSEGPWMVHSAANLVHLGTASVWAGGVMAMTTLAWSRHRRSEPLDLTAMIVRFSSVATVSLVGVVVAGLVMTWLVLDSPGDLFTSTWGRLLLTKTGAVAVAAGLGGYNHFRLRPALEHRPDDPRLAREVRTTLSIEAAVFVAVIAITAVLVAAAT